MLPSKLKNTLPQHRHIYKFYELDLLRLPDSPALNISVNGKEHPIQDSHVTSKQVIEKCPTFKNSLWEYLGETDECIPIFRYVGPQDQIKDLIDTEPYKSPFGRSGQGGLWVTPKGLPRVQPVF